jgi:hypothetical protein
MKHVETKITSGLDFHEREFRITSFYRILDLDIK